MILQILFLLVVLSITFQFFPSFDRGTVDSPNRVQWDVSPNSVAINSEVELTLNRPALPDGTRVIFLKEYQKDPMRKPFLQEFVSICKNPPTCPIQSMPVGLRTIFVLFHVFRDSVGRCSCLVFEAQDYPSMKIKNGKVRHSFQQLGAYFALAFH